MKEKLIEALKSERELFRSRLQDTTEHDVAIRYLETGCKPKEYYHFELLTSCVEDFDTMCKDYEVDTEYN